MGIYAIECIANNKFYIGSSVRLERRRVEHFSNLRNNRYSKSKIQLQNDFNELGEEAFVFRIIQEVDDEDELVALEETYIQLFDSRENGYNKHICQIPTSREKLRVANSGERNGMYNKRHSEETREKMSRVRKEKGMASGLNNTKAVLAKDDFDKIVQMLSENTGESFAKKYKRISDIFGVSERTIKRIKLGSHHFYGLERKKYD
jgi:group I intron endonuclease